MVKMSKAPRGITDNSRFIAHHKVPALDSWEIVLDLRPKMESYVKGTNDN